MQRRRSGATSAQQTRAIPPQRWRWPASWETLRLCGIWLTLSERRALLDPESTLVQLCSQPAHRLRLNFARYPSTVSATHRHPSASPSMRFARTGSQAALLQACTSASDEQPEALNLVGWMQRMQYEQAVMHATAGEQP